ncbi:hypothetical protein DJ568_06090 [Mucilaginibacter hurinus]|uniref:Uncharacterized protein n=1 Tax=Mucilaginibacter hurinus TaxID=2201324 RepID=A0A367GPS3_9SPHI|nr:hypothetical protein [Mucilaginibacter hurinus]RCH55462.1 hypothetical protein DJ568_06090 [Mucilaginibacter hurinus]
MKKILTLVLLIGVAVVSSSCRKEITQVVQPNQTIHFTVNANDWELGNDDYTYSVTLDIPEIDNYFQENGAVLVYISSDGGSTYEQVPEVYNGQAFSFSHTRGGIQIDSQPYDGQTPALDNPGGMLVKVVLVDSTP